MKKIMMFKKMLACLVFAFALPGMAQHIPTLEEAAYGGLIRTQGGSYVNWLPDGNHYSKTERRDDGMYEVASYSAANDERSVLITAEQLINPATGKQLRVRSFQFDAAGRQILIYTNTIIIRYMIFNMINSMC